MACILVSQGKHLWEPIKDVFFITYSAIIYVCTNKIDVLRFIEELSSAIKDGKKVN